MLYLSVSAIKDYLTCPKIYWYRVHKKTAFVSDRFIFRGNVVHQAIERTNNEEDAILFVNNLYREGIKYSNNKIQDELEAIKMIHNYYTMIEPNLMPKQDASIEKMFKIPWNDKAYIVGKIDRIDREAYSIANVYDWKTSMTIPDSYELQDMQFYLYGWAYSQIHRGEEPSIYYGHLYSGQLFPIDINKGMWYNISRLINDTIEKLTNEDAIYPRLFGYKCKKCFYKGVCWSDYELGN